MSPHPEPFSHLSRHPIPLNCHRALGLGPRLPASNLHWSSILSNMCMVMYNAVLSNHPTLAFSHWVQKSVLYICVSFSALHVGSSVSSLSIPCICISIRHLSSFWLTSLCIIGSGFIHLIRTDSKALRLQLLLPHSLVVGTIFGVWFSHCPLVSQYMT